VLCAIVGVGVGVVAVMGATNVESEVPGGSRKELLTTDELMVASVDRTLTTAVRPAWVGIIVHTTAKAMATPIRPVVAVNPRPSISGGSDSTQASRPTSLGWRQPRS